MSHRDFTYEQIAEAFEYDPEEGTLWRKGEDGLTEVSLVWESTDYNLQPAKAWFRAEQQIVVTHIIFMLMTGRWPERGMYMDHKDRDRRNCKWDNLCESTPRQSNINRRGWSANDEGLERGVYRHYNRYVVRFTIQGKTTYFGGYDNKHEANALARSIRESIQGEYSAESSRPPNHDYAMSGG
jgi:hypothetical protein